MTNVKKPAGSNSVAVLILVVALIAFGIIAYVLSTVVHHQPESTSTTHATGQVNKNTSQQNANVAAALCVTDADCAAACGGCFPAQTARQLLCPSQVNADYSCSCTQGRCEKSAISASGE